ncbi:hypothetical protein ABZ318_26635 [Streptomyces sp. NPDC006197]
MALTLRGGALVSDGTVTVTKYPPQPFSKILIMAAGQDRWT